MNDQRLRAWHRRIGIAFVFFVMLQTITGLSLDLSWFVIPHDSINRLGLRNPDVLEGINGGWKTVLKIIHTVHLGGLLTGAAYRTILAMALLFLSITGVMIFRQEKKHVPPKTLVTDINKDLHALSRVLHHR